MLLSGRGRAWPRLLDSSAVCRCTEPETALHMAVGGFPEQVWPLLWNTTSHVSVGGGQWTCAWECSLSTFGEKHR